MENRLAAGCVLAALLLGIGSSRPTLGQTPADVLYQRGLQRFAGASADSQRAGLADLEEAARLAPRRKDIGLALGRACLERGRVGRARACLTRISRVGADDFETWFLLGMAWKRDWLQSLDRASLEAASRCLERATRADPRRSEVWVAKASLDLLLGRRRDAQLAALAARQADPQGADPLLAFASAAYRSGELAAADSAFRAARARSRERWEASFTWDGSDPDLTTPENEAELDALTRWTLARFLFREGDSTRWDRRSELFVRYGPPAAIEYAPAWAQVGENELSFSYPRHAHIEYAPAPIPVPYHMQVWHYPQLGFDVVLWDRSLNQNYELPYSNTRNLDPRPDPALLRDRTDLVALEGGRGVFRALPPGAAPLSLRAAVNRFPMEDGVRLLAYVSSPGGPGDSLWGAWAVVDSRGKVVHRDSGPLSVSACDPGHEQAGQFEARVPPGVYRVDVAVRRGRQGRGVGHLGVRIESSSQALAMSDLVLTCGEAPTVVNAVHIDPNVERHVRGARSIVVYYELEHLTTGPTGVARFSYTCTVRPLGRDRQPGGASATVYDVTREEENVGPHRRQFVTIPVASLPDGPYQVRIEVRDLESGQEMEGSLSFTKGDLSSAAEARR